MDFDVFCCCCCLKFVVYLHISEGEIISGFYKTLYSCNGLGKKKSFSFAAHKNQCYFSGEGGGGGGKILPAYF